jgi:hypothetical protein
MRGTCYRRSFGPRMDVIQLYRPEPRASPVRVPCVRGLRDASSPSLARPWPPRWGLQGVRWDWFRYRGPEEGKDSHVPGRGPVSQVRRIRPSLGWWQLAQLLSHPGAGMELPCTSGRNSGCRIRQCQQRREATNTGFLGSQPPRHVVRLDCRQWTEARNPVGSIEWPWSRWRGHFRR